MLELTQTIMKPKTDRWTYLRQIVGPIFLHPIRKFGGIRMFDQGQKVNVIKVQNVKELLLIIMCYYFILRKYIM